MTTKGSSESAAESRPQNVARNIVFALIMLIVVLGIFEIILRTTHLFGAKISWSEPHPVLSWQFTPGSKYWFFKENDHPITGTINAYGYRDREWSLGKPENTYRIAVLGDSYVAAFQVERDSTFLALAERKLNSIHERKVELMNFGRSGYTQTEELLVLRDQVIQFEPDLVVLFFLTGNDVEDVRRETTADRLRPFFHISEDGQLVLDTRFTGSREFKIKSQLNWFKQRSALISLAAERYNVYQRDRRLRALGISASDADEVPDRISGSLSLCTANPDSQFQRSYNLNKMLITAMVEFCGQRQVPFMLVTVDNPAYRPEVEDRYKSVDPTFDPNYFEDDLAHHAASLGIEYMGLQRTFRQAYQELGVPLHWGHWNYEGHRVVAEALVQKIETLVYSQESGA